jgi:dihydrofolate synthase/folylpolyglutamate synthase
MATAAERIDRILAPLKLRRTHPGGFALEKTFEVLKAIGDPHRRIPPAIHVAGTNGKGSLVAFLRAFYEAAGYRVHMTISPDLVRVNERIYLAGTYIADEALADLLDEIEPAGRAIGSSHFEVLTAAAFLAFSRTQGDVCLLETGLGGRLDSTNVVAKPAVTAITPISFDHMAYLGDTIAKIAGEKAAIMKPNVPAVIGPQVPEAAQVFDAVAAEVGVKSLSRFGREWTAAKAEDGSLIYESRHGSRRLPPPGLLGDYQYRNAGTAVACVEAFPELPVSESAIAKGLGTVRWPARLQRLRRGLLVEKLPAGCELWLDGTHNEDGARVVTATLRQWPSMPLHLVFGNLKTREPDPIFRHFVGLATSVHAVSIPNEPSSQEPEAIVQAVRRLGLPGTASPGVAAAIDDIVARNRPPMRVLICGSLYLAGHVLRDND